jgi:hypothetical protein
VRIFVRTILLCSTDRNVALGEAMNTLEDRVTFCEQENARLRKRIGRQNGFWLIALLLAIGGSAIAG